MKAFLLERDVIEASGPDATSFLQGQLSQDLDAVAQDDSAWSFLLQPQGKVDALLRITRVNDGRWLLDVDGGYGDAVLERLNRFKLRVKCDLERRDWSCVALRDAEEPPASDGIAVRARWPAHDGFDLLGATIAPDELTNGDEYERLRIEAGWPKMGAELTEKTIPAETGIVDRAVSFTKGCFTGQELVARIDSRGGNVPRHLRGIEAREGAVTEGAALMRDGKQVGSITSASGTIGLAYVSRDVDVPADLTLDGVTVRALALPFA